MIQVIDRREFLNQSAAAAAGLGLSALGAENALGSAKELFQISLAEWSLHKALFAGKLNNVDFARTAKIDYGINAIEFVNQFFKDKAKDTDYLRDLNRRALEYGVEHRLIMIDGEGALGDPDDAKRTTAVENHYRWVDAAKTLNCKMIRVNAQSQGSYEEQQKLAADGLRRLTEFAEKQKIAVVVENHGGLSSNGKWLTGVMRLVGHRMCGTLPDFGNFRVSKDEEYDRYTGVTELMPYAKAVSAKTHDFNELGDETQTDYRRMMKIVLDAGYRGFVGIEYEGEKMSEPDGIKATKKLLERVRVELSKRIK
jgi:L-ribulose-5-phosphate 3-epimerase